MGKGGGSGVPETPVQPPPTQIDYAAMMSPMVAAMQQSAVAQQNMMAQSAAGQAAMIAAMPQVTQQAAPMDWKARNEEIKKKISQDMTLEAEKRRGRGSTILTSSALEDETPKLTKSVLTGS